MKGGIIIKDDKILIIEQASILLFLSRPGTYLKRPVLAVNDHSPVWMHENACAQWVSKVVTAGDINSQSSHQPLGMEEPEPWLHTTVTPGL
jgi:hypothetical protein